LLSSFENFGHLLAETDPLELSKVYKDIPSYKAKFNMPKEALTKLIDYREYGFTE
jgi:hypothetical protein